MGHLARPHPIDSLEVGVKESDPQACIGKCQAERQAHMPTAPEDGNVRAPLLVHLHKVAKVGTADNQLANTAGWPTLESDRRPLFR